MASWSWLFQMWTLSKNFLICHSHNKNITQLWLFWNEVGADSVVNISRHSSLNLTFAHIRLHQIFICRMGYWLKETSIFKISVLKDFFAINSDVDFIKNFQSCQWIKLNISLYKEDQIFKEHPVHQCGLKSQWRLRFKFKSYWFWLWSTLIGLRKAHASANLI